MALFRSLFGRVAREFANDPEKRAQAKQVYDDKVAPQAKEFWKQAEPGVMRAGRSALRGAAKAAVEIKRRLNEEKS